MLGGDSRAPRRGWPSTRVPSRQGEARVSHWRFGLRVRLASARRDRDLADSVAVRSAMAGAKGPAAVDVPAGGFAGKHQFVSQGIGAQRPVGMAVVAGVPSGPNVDVAEQPIGGRGSCISGRGRDSSPPTLPWDWQRIPFRTSAHSWDVGQAFGMWLMPLWMPLRSRPSGNVTSASIFGGHQSRSPL